MLKSLLLGYFFVLFFQILSQVDKCFDHIPVYYQDTREYIDPMTSQTFDFATPMSCKKPQNVIALDPDDDEHYLLTRKPVLRVTLTLFEPTQIQSAISPKTFTA